MMMEQLKEEGADFQQVDYRARSALHVACLKGKLNIAEFLLKESKILDLS